MPDLRIAILGAGAMGATHAAAYAAMSDVSVVGVFSRDAARARSVARLCGARPCSDAASLIDDPEVDAIDVCLPTTAHPATAIAALAAGKHVFCESPLALELDEARQMREAARRAGRLLQVGLLMRSVGAYEHVKAVATSEEHGRLLSITTWRLGSYLHAQAPDRKAHYGDPSTELMTFDFDFVLWAMGHPHRLSSSAVRTAQGGPGEISSLLTFGDGRHATVVASGLMPPGTPFTVGFRALFERATFEHQSIFEEGPPRSIFAVAAGKTPAHPVPVPARDPYHAELRRFVDCIRGQADPALLDVDHAIDALALSKATQRSLKQCESIDVFTIP